MSSSLKEIVKKYNTLIHYKSMGDLCNQSFKDVMKQYPRYANIIPAKYRIELYEEYNDEGGTYYALESVKFYDADDKRIIIEGNEDEYVLDDLRDAFHGFKPNDLQDGWIYYNDDPNFEKELAVNLIEEVDRFLVLNLT